MLWGARLHLFHQRALGASAMHVPIVRPKYARESERLTAQIVAKIKRRRKFLSALKAPQPFLLECDCCFASQCVEGRVLVYKTTRQLTTEANADRIKELRELDPLFLFVKLPGLAVRSEVTLLAPLCDALFYESGYKGKPDTTGWPKNLILL